jgi:hypothetical protein
LLAGSPATTADRARRAGGCPLGAPPLAAPPGTPPLAAVVLTELRPASAPDVVAGPMPEAS